MPKRAKSVLEKNTARIFSCELCRLQVIACRRCDSGRMYCSDCSKKMRRQIVREAKERYQKTPKGKEKHAARQRRYRKKLDEKLVEK